jgi:hypothetical protein
MKILMCENRYRIAAKSTLQGNPSGRDLLAIVRFQLVKSSPDLNWEDEPLNSKSLTFMLKKQLTFN